jgi:hypothetical protein
MRASTGPVDQRHSVMISDSRAGSESAG